jgi:hypothetical protein
MTNPWPRNSGSIDDLRSALHYDPDTGIFTWVRDSSKWMHNGGQIAGCVDDRGRVLIHFKGVQYKAHRLAWAYVHGYWPPDEIDHKNGFMSEAEGRAAYIAAAKQYFGPFMRAPEEE